MMNPSILFSSSATKTIPELDVIMFFNVLLGQKVTTPLLTWNSLTDEPNLKISDIGVEWGVAGTQPTVTETYNWVCGDTQRYVLEAI